MSNSNSIDSKWVNEVPNPAGIKISKNTAFINGKWGLHGKQSECKDNLNVKLQQSPSDGSPLDKEDKLLDSFSTKSRDLEVGEISSEDGSVPEISKIESSPIDEICYISKHFPFKKFSETGINEIKIKTLEEREKYHHLYMSTWHEYHTLVRIFEPIRTKFEEFSKEWQKCLESPELPRQEIMEKIVTNYEELCNDGGIRENKGRFDYIHDRMNHIKQAIADFDADYLKKYPEKQQPPHYLPNHLQQAAMYYPGYEVPTLPTKGINDNNEQLPPSPYCQPIRNHEGREPWQYEARRKSSPYPNTRRSTPHSQKQGQYPNTRRSTPHSQKQEEWRHESSRKPELRGRQEEQVKETSKAENDFKGSRVKGAYRSAPARSACGDISNVSFLSALARK